MNKMRMAELLYPRFAALAEEQGCFLELDHEHEKFVCYCPVGMRVDAVITGEDHQEFNEMDERIRKLIHATGARRLPVAETSELVGAS